MIRTSKEAVISWVRLNKALSPKNDSYFSTIYKIRNAIGYTPVPACFNKNVEV